MTMAWIWGALMIISTVFGVISGNAHELGTAALDGAKAAVELCIGIGGVTCLWTGVMEIFEKSGVMAKIARFLKPVISRLFPGKISDKASKAISANISANLLGLGNAATPLGKSLNHIAPLPENHIHPCEADSPPVLHPQTKPSPFPEATLSNQCPYRYSPPAKEATGAVPENHTRIHNPIPEQTPLFSRPVL